jgi:hypothetical protein
MTAKRTMSVINAATVLALLLFIEIGMAANPLDTWTWASPLPTGDNLSAVTYGNGRFVAVGSKGTTLTSAVGIDWVQHTPSRTF